jgi:hypothetical protein
MGNYLLNCVTLLWDYLQMPRNRRKIHSLCTAFSDTLDGSVILKLLTVDVAKKYGFALH